MFWSKRDSLKKVYYQSFAVLIVIPILLIFMTSLYVVNIMIRNSGISNIKSFQKTVVSSLGEDIRGASLQLSHFAYVNNSELMELAARTDTANPAERYLYTNRLNEAFKIAVAPRQDIISCMVYMKSGNNTYLKDEIVIPNEVIKEEKWYQDAMKNKDNVKIGSYDTWDESIVYTRLKGREFIIAAALSPGISTDKEEKIEVISIFVQTKIGSSIKEYNKKPEYGTTVIIDEKNEIIYGKAFDENVQTLMEQADIKHDGVYSKRFAEADEKKVKYTYVVSSINETGWKVVTYVNPRSLTETFERITWIMIEVIIALFFLFYLFSRYFLKNIITPVHGIVEGYREIEKGNLETKVEVTGHSEIRNMIQSFNQMVGRLKVSIEDNREAQSKKHEAEMRALQSQINPHFLVNTLNSIRFMAQVSQFDGIRRMAESLISILTCSFRQNNSMYTLDEELMVLQSYIYLMKIRYSNGFEVEMSVEDNCRGLLVPRLILQPIVENSIVHGFSETEDIGQITIKVYRKEEKLCIEIEDNGRGMSAEQIEMTFRRNGELREDSYNIGIENVYSRLKLRFGEECSLRMESEQGKYTRTWIVLPIIEEEESGHEESSDS